MEAILSYVNHIIIPIICIRQTKRPRLQGPKYILYAVATRGSDHARRATHLKRFVTITPQQKERVYIIDTAVQLTAHFLLELRQSNSSGYIASAILDAVLCKLFLLPISKVV